MISGMQQQEEAGGADLQQVISGKEEALVFATWDCGSPLYDSFELASLHRVLESHLMVLPFPGAAASRSRRLERRGGTAPPPPPPPGETNSRSTVRFRRREVGRRSKGWRGSKAAAAIFRAVTCWRKL
ncbi:uncharacterized protein LOC120676229 [Panicum virgatum]|uniref:Uncharacterized protein n=1 Tax=Panicum virgatum TaxID=38727 RepID=A0A8T0S0H1_PANVG|nr:uncharacterized protein LOC120676229 [Panicum virgatum]KAG2590558.1 hypothetical protein PVAP13_5NG409600 [Panicum virgatum]